MGDRVQEWTRTCQTRLHTFDGERLVLKGLLTREDLPASVLKATPATNQLVLLLTPHIMK